MSECWFVALITLLAAPSCASGLSERDTQGSASAHQFATDLNEQWEGIVADLSRPDAPHEHHCWPHARPGGPAAAATGVEHKLEASEPSGFELNLTEADLVADLQTTVYCNRTRVWAWNCTRCRSAVASFELHELVFVEDWDLTAIVGRWPLLDAVFVAFRGTDSHDIGNWVADMDLRMTDYPLATPPAQHRRRAPERLQVASASSLKSQLSAADERQDSTANDDTEFTDEDAPRVHSGFLRSLVDSNLYQGVYNALRSLRAKYGTTQERMFITGHSLGGAMAALAAPMLLRDFSPAEIRLYTFGCPRTGNQAFVDLLMASVDYSIRFTHSHDIVPSLPPPFFGFHHFPREVWQIDDNVSSLSEASRNSSNSSEATGHLESFVLHPGPENGPDSGAGDIHYVCETEGTASNKNFTFHICDGSGEDLECHDSLCYWAPCHSLTDHVHYLGKHMYHREEEC